MIYPEIKDIFSPDVEDLENWRPDDESCFAIALGIAVGQKGEEGYEFFNLVVCTPAWLEGRVRGTGPLWLRGTLLVTGYNWERIYNVIAHRVGVSGGESWSDVVRKLGRYIDWESNE